MKKTQGHLKWLWNFTKGTRALLGVLTLTQIAFAAILVTLSYLLKQFVDIATKTSSGTYSRTVLVVLLMTLAVGVTITVEKLSQIIATNRIEQNLRTNFLSKIFTQDFAAVNSKNSGELMTLLTNDAQAAAEFFPNIVIGIIGQVLQLMFAVTTMFLLFWKLALIVAAIVPISMFLLNLFAPTIEKRSIKNKGDEENLRSFLQETTDKILLFKLYSMSGKLIHKVKSGQSEKQKSAVNLGIIESLSKFVNNFFNIIIGYMVLGIGAFFVLHGEVELGALIALSDLVSMATNAFSNTSIYISQIAQTKASVERLRAVTDLPSEQEQQTSKLTQNPIVLQTQNLWFDYSGNMVLQGAEIEAKKTQKVAIAGESGSGKSTLTKLIMGLYKPSAGAINLVTENGENIENIRDFVSYVPSDNFTFSGTIAENIAMDMKVDKTRLEKSAKLAKIDEFVKTLPNGFDETISTDSLSSGQAQRIGIARALYRDAPVLIFDEPTSNLDSDTISAFHDTINEVAKDKICVIVTHDLATIAMCDAVYRLRDGKTVNG